MRVGAHAAPYHVPHGERVGGAVGSHRLGRDGDDARDELQQVRERRDPLGRRAERRGVREDSNAEAEDAVGVVDGPQADEVAKGLAIGAVVVDDSVRQPTAAQRRLHAADRRGL
eukprot:4531632-Prymnesium_polylepis.1